MVEIRGSFGTITLPGALVPKDPAQAVAFIAGLARVVCHAEPMLGDVHINGTVNLPPDWKIEKLANPGLMPVMLPTLLRPHN